LFASLGGAEQLLAAFDADAHASFIVLDGEFSGENARGRRALKRSPRGKSSLKSLPVFHEPARAIALIVRIRETSSGFRLSKSSVYQQIHVYRI
jgi:hypothetical protein